MLGQPGQSCTMSYGLIILSLIFYTFFSYGLVIFVIRFKTLTLLIVVDLCRAYYRYWTWYYGLPVAGWNAGNDGKNYLNIKGLEQENSFFIETD